MILKVQLLALQTRVNYLFPREFHKIAPSMLLRQMKRIAESYGW